MKQNRLFALSRSPSFLFAVVPLFRNTKREFNNEIQNKADVIFSKLAYNYIAIEDIRVQIGREEQSCI